MMPVSESVLMRNKIKFEGGEDRSEAVVVVREIKKELANEEPIIYLFSKHL